MFESRDLEVYRGNESAHYPLFEIYEIALVYIIFLSGVNESMSYRIVLFIRMGMTFVRLSNFYTLSSKASNF